MTRCCRRSSGTRRTAAPSGSSACRRLSSQSSHPASPECLRRTHGRQRRPALLRALCQKDLRQRSSSKRPRLCSPTTQPLLSFSHSRRRSTPRLRAFRSWLNSICRLSLIRRHRCRLRQVRVPLAASSVPQRQRLPSPGRALTRRRRSVSVPRPSGRTSARWRSANAASLAATS